MLFVIRLATREVQIAGLVPEPNEAWMKQVARNLIDPQTGFLRQSRLLIHDRGTVLSEQLRLVLGGSNIDSSRLSVYCTNQNVRKVKN